MTHQIFPESETGHVTLDDQPLVRGIFVPADVSRWGEAMRSSAKHIWIKVSGKDTMGEWSAWESLVPGRFGVPLHFHIKQDEWFWVLSGEIVFEVGDERFRLTAGTSLFCPRKVPHRWKSVVDSVSRLLILAQPTGRLEEFFERFEQLTPDQVQDAGQISALFAECEMEVVGPPLQDSVM